MAKEKYDVGTMVRYNCRVCNGERVFVYVGKWETLEKAVGHPLYEYSCTVCHGNATTREMIELS